MSKLSTIFAVLIAGVFAPAFYASSLQDWEFNVNGTTYYPAKGSTLASIPGVNLSGFNLSTDLGTIQITVGKTGANYVGGFVYNPAGIPFYNEYGASYNTLATGETWQIDVPEYDVASANHGAGTIIDNLANETLSDTNSVPGSTTNYLNNCGANGGGSANASCNDFVSSALAFSFTLKAGQTETVDFTIGSSVPATLFTEGDIHPIDGSNAAAVASYFSGSATPGSVPPPPPPPSGAPEPASAGLAAVAVGLLAFAKMRLSRRDGSK
jgi:hypothetical protein